MAVVPTTLGVLAPVPTVRLPFTATAEFGNVKFEFPVKVKFPQLVMVGSPTLPDCPNITVLLLPKV
ncbi:hypothetical protein D3C83_301190 [compost metagenome]